MSSPDENLRYPIGKFSAKEFYSAEEMQRAIQTIESLPAKVENVIRNFSQQQLDTPYRDGGWTARQVLHHMADSHMNAYVRMKWTLTEETPVIKAYDEKRWAETAETELDPSISINLLKPLHVKWVALIRSFTPGELMREFVHPETQKRVRLDRMINLYAWHCEHHFGHLKIVADKK